MYNYSYLLLFPIWFQCHVASIRFATVRVGYMNNHSPRVALAEMEKSGKYSPRLVAKLRRRQAAHENCLEMIGFFAAVVVAGNTAGLSSEWMNFFSMGYFLLRWVYIYAYIKIDSDKLSLLRTLVWYTLNGLMLATLIKAGKAVNGGVGLLG
ncbi:hypothetical protein EHS25_009473 [Saitozyma podzolica]|uniref:Uncharacterized protein n=1 Tax=Saitozyma podzolica TaxID=1890683 RepID=A0A427YJ97_9TREE|nr:hypothetical protein EHS25_009473 [Saitozyma podzolica]